jgi:D-3-phosphoglycerate dehydrogenase / 2-oxoglutarate reductase
MAKVLITTVPFADRDPYPLKILRENGIDFLINPLGRKLTESELAGMVEGFDVLIAGTERISEHVLKCATNLKLISRVGIGLDSVDLVAAKRLGIQVSYTPDAPAPAVAELTISSMLSLLRHMHDANIEMHRGHWNRHFGRRVSNVTVGVIGVGRIGRRVIDTLLALKTPRILVNDIRLVRSHSDLIGVEWVDKELIYQEADVISVHVPLTAQTKNMVRYEQLKAMKPDAMVINTSRGGIINEQDLAKILSEGHLSGAAVDVFEQEPYAGELAKIERCLLTSHMGSMSVDCRTRMEIEATEEAVRFLTGRALTGLVPPEEYDAQRQGL